jgi:hypothetical protein
LSDADGLLFFQIGQEALEGGFIRKRRLHASRWIPCGQQNLAVRSYQRYVVDFSVIFLKETQIYSKNLPTESVGETLYWTVASSPRHSVGFLASRSIDSSIAKSIHFSIKSFIRS